MIKYGSIAIIFVILLGVYFSFTVDQTVEIRASEGELLIQPGDLTDEKIISLDGEWAFYWQQFLTTDELEKNKEAQQYINVPSDWTLTTKESNGYATYSLTLTIPDDQLGNTMGIYIPHQYTSYSLHANGVEIATNGLVGTSRETSEPGFRKDLTYITPSESEIQFTMYVSNFEHIVGGANRSILFGTAHAISTYYTNLVALTLFVTGGILVMGINQLGIFFFRRKEKTFLYFGLLSILIALRAVFIEPIFIAEMFPDIFWLWQHRIEFFIIYGSFSLYLMFLYDLYPSEMKKWIVQVSFVLVTILSGVTFFTYPPAYILVFNYFIYIAAVIMLYTIYVLMVAVKRNRPTAILNLSASVLFFLTILNDVLVTFDMIRGPYLATYGFFSYILIQSLNLSRNYARKFKESESLTVDLIELNRTLDDKIDLRTKELQDTNGKLRELTYLDGLTGVNNRRFFDDKMAEEVSKSKENKEPMTLLMLDLDEFKNYNDSYGHVMGDELIKNAATMFKQVMGNKGCVARYGGEEFVIIIPNCGQKIGREYANLICQRLLDAKVTHINSSMNEFATISIGGTSSSNHNHVKPGDWIELADKALYQSKLNGKNQVTML